MTWKEYKDWVESQGVKDDMNFNPETDEEEMVKARMEIYMDRGVARIVYKQD